MHTVELLEEAIALAERVGYQIRQEWLGDGGTGVTPVARGGACEIKGRKWIFLDLAAGPVEHVEQVLDALRREPGLISLPMSCQLRDLLELRKTA